MLNFQIFDVKEIDYEIQGKLFVTDKYFTIRDGAYLLIIYNA